MSGGFTHKQASSLII